jgi:hypothetical protein
MVNKKDKMKSKTKFHEWISISQKNVNTKPPKQPTSKYYHLMCKTNIGFDIFFGGNFFLFKIKLGVNIMNLKKKLIEGLE